MKRFRFSIGDTNDGTVGYAVTVEAATQGQALKIIRRDLANVIDGVDVKTGSPRMRWERLYINPKHILLAHIEMIED